jgi:hypothetical protein
VVAAFAITSQALGVLRMVCVPDPMKSLGFNEEFLAARRARFSTIGTIRCGVLFFMAFWSIYARQAFAELKRVLAEVDPDGRLELVAVDVDGCTELDRLPELGGMYLGAGAGETAWVKDGRVVATSGLGLHLECFGPNTRALLDESRS